MYEACIDGWMNRKMRILAMKTRYPDAMQVAPIVSLLHMLCELRI